MKIKIIKDNCKRFGGLQVLIQSDVWKWLMKFIDKEQKRVHGIVLSP